MIRETKFRCWDGKEMRSDLALECNGTVRTTQYCAEGEPGTIVSWQLMQFTGLKDKNGKEIYEGDVIHFDALDANYPAGRKENHIFDGEVVFSSNGFYARVPQWGDVRFYPGEWAEIIGNIYENPDLLK